jgi:hypothetical protein
MNIENTTDFSNYLNKITDNEERESEPFYMNEIDYQFCKDGFTKIYGVITDRQCTFLIWRNDLEGADLDTFFLIQKGTFWINNERYTPEELIDLNFKFAM